MIGKQTGMARGWVVLAGAACLLAGGVAWGQEAGKVDLRPQYVAGRVTRYGLWEHREQAVTVSAAGQQRNFHSSFNLSAQMTWTVESVHEDGSATCVMNINYMLATVVGADGSRQVCDTRKPKGDNEGLQRILTAMATVPVRVEMAADGSVLSVSGVDRVRQMIKAGSKSPTDLSYMETASDLATLPYAPAGLATGGGWGATYRWEFDGGLAKFIDLPTRYRLASVQVLAGIPVAGVEMTAKARMEPDFSQLPATAPKIDFRQIDGQYQGQALVDLDRHEVVGRNTVLTTHYETRTHRADNVTVIGDVQETSQGQLLRIAEN